MNIYYGMKKDKLLLNEEINRLKVLMESGYEGKNLIVVDIQPEYQRSFGFYMRDFCEFINDNYETLSSITLLYNGKDTMGMVDEIEYKMWLIDEGLNEEILDHINFYDKGYAFFRYCMDNSIEEESIVNLVKFMIQKNIHTSDEIDADMWDQFVEENGDKNVQELLDQSDDFLVIPELMNYLESYRNILLCGGGIYECFKEVEIALQALNIPYNTYNRFIY